MSKSSSNRSTMFLMEIIIAILFFSLVSAVCLRVFTKTHQMNTETDNLNHAVFIVANTAELLRHSDGDLEAVKATYPSSVMTGGTLTAYYDSEWTVCSDTQAAYQLHIAPDPASENKNLQVYDISMQNTVGDAIYDLTVRQHVPNR